MATISNTPRPGYVWDSTDNVWYPIGVGAHQHTNAADTPAVMPYSTYAAAGKNKILNGDFNINQRTFSSASGSALGQYSFDRWFVTNAGGTYNPTAQTFTPGTAPVTGYESINFLRNTTSGQSASGDYSLFLQRIEDARTFANQTATISFWAKASSGTPKIGLEIGQNFGAGGSPSTGTDTPIGSVTLSTSWARYSITTNVLSISGKTFGTTANSSYLQLVFWLSAGSSFATRASAIGIQNTTIDVWGVQMEAGSTATAFQTTTGNPASELAACQRYYISYPNSASDGYALLGIGYVASGTAAYFYIKLNQTMRTAPTMTYSAASTFGVHTGGGTLTACTSMATNRATADTVWITGNVASGLTTGNSIMLIGNNSNTVKLEASAEL